MNNELHQIHLTTNIDECVQNSKYYYIDSTIQHADISHSQYITNLINSNINKLSNSTWHILILTELKNINIHNISYTEQNIKLINWFHENKIFDLSKTNSNTLNKYLEIFEEIYDNTQYEFISLKPIIKYKKLTPSTLSGRIVVFNTNTLERLKVPHNQTIGTILNYCNDVKKYHTIINIYTRPFFSIIMPVYNGMDYIRESLTSVYNQTLNNWELVVVDDGSTDGTSDFLDKEISNTKHNITLIHQPNGKIPRALNSGLINCTGKFITWISHDNIMLDDYLQTFYKIITMYTNGQYDKKLDIDSKKFPIEFIYAGTTYFGDKNTNGNFGLVNMRRMFFAYPSIPAFVWNFNSLIKVGYYDVNLYGIEDLDYLYRTFEANPIIFSIKKIVYKYRFHEKQLTSDINRRKGWNELNDKLFDKFIDSYYNNFDLKVFYPFIDIFRENYLHDENVLTGCLMFDLAHSMLTLGSNEFIKKKLAFVALDLFEKAHKLIDGFEESFENAIILREICGKIETGSDIELNNGLGLVKVNLDTRTDYFIMEREYLKKFTF